MKIATVIHSPAKVNVQYASALVVQAILQVIFKK
jgi:hypothetical protein